MIIAAIDNIEKYAKVMPGIVAAVETALNLWPDIKSGKLDISEKYKLATYTQTAEAEAYFFFQRGATSLIEGTDSLSIFGSNSGRVQQFEAHRKFIDVQILIEGAEEIVWAPIDKLDVSEAYIPEKDIELLKGSGTIIKIKPGTCYILLPDDGHLACGHTSEQSEYSKLIIKLPIV